MPAPLHSRFLAIEQQFFVAFSAGEHSVISFAETWESLLRDFAAAKKIQDVDAETSRLAHCVASRLALLADTLLSLDSHASKLLDKYTNQCTAILSPPTEKPVSLSSTSISCLPPSSLCMDEHDYSRVAYNVPTPDTSHRLHPIAQEWLLRNLHDPYPPPSMKTSMAESSGCTAKDVQEWFADARRHIGWTTLARERFGGSRQAISAAASRVYTSAASDRDIPVDICRAFATIKANAESMHIGQPESHSQMESYSGTPTHDDDSPSCVHSIAPLSSSIPIAADEDEDVTPPPPVAGCKRRFDVSNENVDEWPERPCPRTSIQTRPSKRQCNANTILSHHAPSVDLEPMRRAETMDTAVEAGQRAMPRDCHTIHRPEHVAAESQWQIQFPHSQIFLSSTLVAPPPHISISSRKRRLSDAGSGTSPKRPRSQASGPRKQAVSDPLPTHLAPSTSIEDYLQANIAPTAMDKDAFDSSLMFDSQLSTFSKTGDEHPFLPYPGPITPTCYLDVSDADLASASAGPFDFSTFDLPHLLTDLTSYSQSNPIQSPSNSSGTSSPSFSSSADSDIVDGSAYLDSAENWIEFINILDSCSSPTPPTVDPPPSFQPTSNTCSSDSDDFFNSLFEVDPSFTSDLLSDIGEFSSLHTPLEAII